MGRISLVFLVFVALFADCLAGDRPIVLSAGGELQILGELTVQSGAPLRGEELAEALSGGDWAVWPLLRIDPLAVRSGGALHVLQAPGGRHLLGTDDRGRDVASRLIHGTRNSMLLALLCGLFATLLGCVLAILACRSTWLDTLVMYGCDAIAAIPALLVVLTLRGMTGSDSVVALIALVSITRSATTARVVRDGLRGAMGLPFYEAARGFGFGEFHLLLRQALPQCWGQIRVCAALAASTAVLTEVALSFLGLGAFGPEPSWGELLRQAQENQLQWWLLLPAGVLTSLSTWSLRAWGQSRPPKR